MRFHPVGEVKETWAPEWPAAGKRLRVGMRTNDRLGEHRQMKRTITCALGVLLLLGSAAPVLAKSSTAKDSKYADAKGPYANLGLAISKTNFSAADAQVGFAIAGGYRFIDWLAADVEMYSAWREQSGVTTRVFGFTMNAKAYPIGLISPTTLDWLQPYVVVGMGGGQAKNKFSAGDVKTGTYIFRLGAGTEAFITDHFAAYMDLSLHATPGYKVGGNGGATGVIQFGVAYHF